MTAGSIFVPQIIPLRYSSGQRKNVIDCNTKIELKTQSQNCAIYYTLNNKKPDPFQQYGEKYTYKFKRPFTLAPGKVVIKAVAMSSDQSNYSSVVTKLFIVHEGEQTNEFVDEEDEEQTVKADISLSDQFKERVRTVSRESIRNGLMSTSRPESPPTGLSLATPIAASTPNIHNVPAQSSDARNPRSKSSPIFIPPLVPAKPKLVCVYCSFPRDPDPSAEFCANCGSQLPPLPKMENKSLRMAVCPSCRAEQPPGDSDLCLVCNTNVVNPTPLPTIRGQSGVEVKMESILCLYCGTQNVPHLSHCVTCVNTLHPDNTSGHSLPSSNGETIMHPITGSTYVMCGACGRVNVSDARYCDWCGCRPKGSDVQLMCQSCECKNDWTSRFCSKCGSIVKCPLRPEIEEGSKMRRPSGVVFDDHKWVPIANVDMPTEDKCILAQAPSKSQATQTQGLFYASSNTITAKKTGEMWQKLIKTASQDKVLELSTYSPGKGKWRNQVEHICSHLKAHSASSGEFQESVSDCQIGKILKSSAEIDKANSNQLLVNLIFSLKDPISNTSSLSRHYFPHIGRSRRNSGLEESMRRRSSSSSVRRPPLKRTSSINIKVEDHLLIAEVGPDGKGRKDIITSLIEKGANVNSTDTVRGLPVLLLATSNGHTKAVEAMLENGADINVVAKKTGNSALHEAVKTGEKGKSVIKTLLSSGANPNLRNKERLTPCELATKLGHSNLVTDFASHFGSNMLGAIS